MNSSHTDELSVTMRGSRNFSHGGGGGGDWGSTSIWQKKNTLTAFFVCLFLFFAFFLVLGLFNWSQMVNFKEKYHFQGSGGGPNFSRGGGGEFLTPYRNPNNLWFSRGSGPPGPSPLDPHLAAIYLVSQSAKWCDRLLTCTCARFPATSLYVFSQALQ